MHPNRIRPFTEDNPVNVVSMARKYTLAATIYPTFNINGARIYRLVISGKDIGIFASVDDAKAEVVKHLTTKKDTCPWRASAV